MPRECPVCGEETLVLESGTFRFDPPASVPGGSIEIQGASWEECASCKERIILPALRRALEEEALRRQGLLPASEIRAVRERTGLSQREMARRLGAGEKTYARWESGRSVQNRSSDNLIRLLDQDPEAFARLEARRQPDRQAKVAAYFRLLGELKGRNDGAVAAHGFEVGLVVGKELRKRLREILRAQKGE